LLQGAHSASLYQIAAHLRYGLSFQLGLAFFGASTLLDLTQWLVKEYATNDAYNFDNDACCFENGFCGFGTVRDVPLSSVPCFVLRCALVPCPVDSHSIMLFLVIGVAR
jgi:hypothetical protein